MYSQSPRKIAPPEADDVDEFLGRYAKQRVREEAQKQGVDPSLAERQFGQESAYKPDVIKGQRRSSAGAIGTAQLMPGTAKELGVDPYNIDQNVEGGVRYMKQQLDTFGGDRRKALAAYNAGPGAVRKAGGVPNIRETQDYVNKIEGAQQKDDVDEFLSRYKEPAAQPSPTPEQKFTYKEYSGLETDPAKQKADKQNWTRQFSTNYDLDDQGPPLPPPPVPKRFRDQKEIGNAFRQREQQQATQQAQKALDFRQPGGATFGIQQQADQITNRVVDSPQTAQRMAAREQYQKLSPMQRMGTRVAARIGGATPQQIGEVARPVDGIEQAVASGTSAAIRGAGSIVRGVPGMIRTSQPGIGNQLARQVEKVTTPLSQRIGGAADTLAPTNLDDQSWLTNKIPAALGSAAPFIAGSMATGGGAAAPAVLGALGSAGQFSEDAARSGKTLAPTRQAAGEALAVATGLTEALGVGRALKSMGIAKPVVERAAQILEESGQEYAQKYLEDINAKLVSGYDPNRSLSPTDPAKLEAAALGAIVGGGMAAPSLPGDIRAQRGESAVRRELLRPMGLTPTTMGPTARTSIVEQPKGQTEPLKQPTQQIAPEIAPSSDDAISAALMDDPELADVLNFAGIKKPVPKPAAASKPAKPQFDAGAFRGELDNAKIEAGNAEKSNNWEAARDHYRSAMDTITEMQKDARRNKDAATLTELAREKSATNTNWQVAKRNAERAARQQVSAPQVPPTHQLKAPVLPAGDQLVNQLHSIPENSQAIENATTRDLTAPLPEDVEQTPRNTAEIPQILPEDVQPTQQMRPRSTELPAPLTPPTNQIIEGAGDQLPRRVSRPLEGQPIEVPENVQPVEVSPPVAQRPKKAAKAPEPVQETDVDFATLAEQSAAERAANRERSQRRKMTGNLSPVEYLKRKTNKQGFRVSDKGEARKLGSKEAGIVGLTNKRSKWSTHDAQVMLDEGGFAMPDGRAFTDPSVTENDVLTFLGDYGKQARQGTADLERRLMDEEEAYYRQQEDDIDPEAPNVQVQRQRESLPPVERRRAVRDAVPRGQFGKLSEAAHFGAPRNESLAGNVQLRRLLDLPEMPPYHLPDAAINPKTGKPYVNPEWQAAAQDTLNALAATSGKERSSQINFGQGDKGTRGEMGDLFVSVRKLAQKKGERLDPALAAAFKGTVEGARQSQRGYQEFTVDERVENIRNSLRGLYGRGKLSRDENTAHRNAFREIATEYGISQNQADQLFAGTKTEAGTAAERSRNRAAKPAAATGSPDGSRRLVGGREQRATGTEGGGRAAVSEAKPVDTKPKARRKNAPKEPWEMTREEFESPKTDRYSYFFKTGRGTVEVFKNPSSSEYTEINKRFREEYPNAPQGEPKSRITFDKYENRYAWMSGDGLHDTIEPLITKETGLSVTQQRVYHKDVVKQALAEGKPVPTEVLADYPDLQPKGAINDPQPQAPDVARDPSADRAAGETASKTRQLKEIAALEWSGDISAAEAKRRRDAIEQKASRFSFGELPNEPRGPLAGADLGGVAQTLLDRRRAAKKEKDFHGLAQKMKEVERSAWDGALTSIPDLRAAMTEQYPTKKAFDDFILSQAKNEKITLARHDLPSSLSEADKQKMVSDGKGGYYIGAALLEEYKPPRASFGELKDEPKGPVNTMFGGQAVLDALRKGKRPSKPNTLPANFNAQNWAKGALKELQKVQNDPVKYAALKATILDAQRSVQANNLRDFQDAALRAKAITDDPATNWEKASAIRKAAMLSRPVSHLRNLLGNTVFQNLEEGARVPGSIADSLLSVATNRRSLQGASVTDSAHAVYAAATDGIQAAKDAMAGRSKEDLAKALQVKEINFNNRFVDKAVKTVFRSLGAEDQVFFTGAYDRAIREAAKLHARNEARQGVIARRDVSARQKALLAAPTAQMEIDSTLAAETAVFRNDNRLSTAISAAREHIGDKGNFALDLVLPFDRTPTNVVLRALEYSPIGVARGAVKGVAGTARAIGARRQAGKSGTPSKADIQAVIDKAFTPAQQRSAAQLLGRGTVGSGLLALGYALAAKGLMTGFYDEEDYKGEAYKRAAGAQPLAIKAGGRWWGLNGIGPIGMALGMGATMHDESKKKGGDIYGGAAKAAKDQILEAPLLSSAKDMGKDIGRVAKDRANAGKLVGNLAASFVPGIVGDVTQSIPYARDPFEREVKDDPKKVRGVRRALREGAGQIGAKIPGVRRALPVKKDITGQSVEARPLQAVDPFSSRDARPVARRR